MTIKEISEKIERIGSLDESAMEAASQRWDQVAKPLYSLGVLEKIVTQIAGMRGTADVRTDRKALVIMCSDNGVVEEGVTQTGQEVTAVVTENFTKGKSCVCIMAEKAGIHVFPVDIGVAREITEAGRRYPLISRNIRRGARNMAREPAMTREETWQAIGVGISLAGELKDKGYQMIATGEMGIGNTTTSSAVSSVLLNKKPEIMTGKGAGLSDEGLRKKVDIIRGAIELHRPDASDGIDVLSKLGGYDLAGMAGLFLGGGIYRIPVVIDGFISATAALAAMTLCPAVKSFMLASHVSAEPAGPLLLKALGLTPFIQAGMSLGEGTGAVAGVALIDMAVEIYNRMGTFHQMEIDPYQPY